MIKLKSLLLQSTYHNKQLSQQQFIQLFKQNCKDIKSFDDIAYRGRNYDNDFIQFTARTQQRISRFMHDGQMDSYYN